MIENYCTEHLLLILRLFLGMRKTIKEPASIAPSCRAVGSHLQNEASGKIAGVFTEAGSLGKSWEMDSISNLFCNHVDLASWHPLCALPNGETTKLHILSH